MVQTESRAATWLYRYPEETQALLAKIVEACVDHLVLQVLAGAEVLQISDSSAGELSPSSFRNFALPYLRTITEQLPQRLKLLGHSDLPPTIVFAKGAWYALDDLCQSGYDVVSLDWHHDPAEAVRIANGRVTLQGNADPGILYEGRQAIKDSVEQMCEGFGRQRWIVNLGHGITPFVDPEDLKFFF